MGEGLGEEDTTPGSLRNLANMGVVERAEELPWRFHLGLVGTGNTAESALPRFDREERESYSQEGREGTTFLDGVE